MISTMNEICPRWCGIWACRVVLMLIVCRAPAFCSEPIDFARDIQPVLSDKCFACHGPDPSSLQADLRLDQRETAIASVIVPGKPAESELMRRVRSTDASTRMPPADSGLSLTERDIDLLERWISGGAEYALHWSFQPLPKQVALPEVERRDWPRGAIDRFVLARLEQEGIEPSPQAAPLRWLRRATFDLTGLPPRPEEIREFERQWKAEPARARSAAVDALLASPAFGEQMAIGWLDGARYADSHGLQSDQLHHQWPYRDWVVRAFNDNLLYDAFLTWQLAGDCLETPTQDQLLATAFNRLHRMTNEGGSVPQEWLVENASDRVHTFSTLFLGLTVECARCHDHKFDPILAQDYYALTAFFNSIDENGLYDHPGKVPSPSMLLTTPEQERALEKAKAAIDTAEKALADTITGGETRFQAWRATDEPLRFGIDEQIHLTFNEAKPPFANQAAGQSDEGLGEGHGAPAAMVPGVDGTGIQLDGDTGIVISKAARLDRWTPLTIAMWLRDPQPDAAPRVVFQQTFGTDVGYNGVDLMLEQGHFAARIYRVWPGNAIGVRTRAAVDLDEWRHVAIRYDGSSTAGGISVIVNGEPVDVEILRNAIQKQANVPAYGQGEMTLGARFRDRGFARGEIDEFQVFHRDLSEIELRQLVGRERKVSKDLLPSMLDDEVAREYYFSAIDRPARAKRKELTELRQAFVMTEEPIHEVAIMRELPEPRPTYLLARGAYDAPRSEENRVSRDVFAQILPPFPDDLPRNRLGLARWLTQPEHPLTARVFVNRVWARFLGQGLVATLDDFGRQGALPTHPELLNWLARDFMDSGWDIKRLCRVIVLSAAYGQDSKRRPELDEIDPANQLLARGPSRRLSAEQIRDLALASSHLIDPGLGGPPVSPYQPGQDLWRESNGMSPPYQQSTGRGLYRRSLYSVRKRTTPLPNMTAFDAPAREFCRVARSPTNTPLQALVLLNDVQFVEAARQLAVTVLAQEKQGDDAARMSTAFLRVCGRSPDVRELAMLQALLTDQRARFQSHPDDAGDLLEVGEMPPPGGMDAIEVASWTVVCQAILNTDSAIWLR